MTNTRSFYGDLIFNSNPSYITECGIEKFLYADTCHHNIVFGKIISAILFLLHMHVKFGNIIKLTKKTSKIVHNLNNKCKSGTFSNTLINIFRNYIPNKKVRFEYGEAPWISKNIKSALCKRSRLTKRYYVNGQVQNDYNLLNQTKKMYRDDS